MKHLLFAIAVSAALIGCSDRKGSSTGPANEAPAVADIAAGKILAERDCKGCHGLDGRGAAPGIPHLAAQNEGYLGASIKAYREGKRTHAALRDMTAGMSEADLRNVVGYYAGLPAITSAAGESCSPLPSL